MFVNVAKRSIYSDSQKTSAHALLHRTHSSSKKAFMIYLLERKTLNECSISPTKKTSETAFKGKQAKGLL
jgi:hypothetical protein